MARFRKLAKGALQAPYQEVKKAEASERKARGAKKPKN